VSTESDWHFSKVVGPGSQANLGFSEQFNLLVGPSRQVEISFSRDMINISIELFAVGYY